MVKGAGPEKDRIHSGWVDSGICVHDPSMSSSLCGDSALATIPIGSSLSSRERPGIPLLVASPNPSPIVPSRILENHSQHSNLESGPTYQPFRLPPWVLCPHSFTSRRIVLSTISPPWANARACEGLRTGRSDPGPASGMTEAKISEEKRREEKEKEKKQEEKNRAAFHLSPTSTVCRR